MKAYRELSKEIGQQKLQEVKYPELMRCEPGGTEDSLVGKMKTRPRRHHRYLYSNSGCPAGSSLINSHTEYISAKKLREAAADGTFEDGKSMLTKVLELVRSGANVARQDLKGRSALHFASSRGATDIVELLIRYGASVNVQDCNGSTPLHLACCTNHIGVVTTLLKSGTDVNALDGRGVTPLHLAYSRLRLARESDDREGQPLSRKREIYGIVDMLREYLVLTKSHRDETDELEALASKLTLSETKEEVDEIQGLLAGFTSLSIQKRGQNLDSGSRELPTKHLPSPPNS